MAALECGQCRPPARLVSTARNVTRPRPPGVPKAQDRHGLPAFHQLLRRLTVPYENIVPLAAQGPVSSMPKIDKPKWGGGAVRRPAPPAEVTAGSSRPRTPTLSLPRPSPTHRACPRAHRPRNASLVLAANRSAVQKSPSDYKLARELARRTGAKDSCPAAGNQSSSTPPPSPTRRPAALLGAGTTGRRCRQGPHHPVRADHRRPLPQGPVPTPW